jgi:hypothetical protein
MDANAPTYALKRACIKMYCLQDHFSIGATTHRHRYIVSMRIFHAPLIVMHTRDNERL